MKKKANLLLFAYYSYKDPVFQSAVLPYFINFPDKKKYFVLLTFEQKKYQLEQKEIDQIKLFLKQHRIFWYRANWHSGRFKVIKKIYDLLVGVIFACFLIFKYKVAGVYSEGFPGAILGHFITKLTSRKHLVHTFEPHADYMVEAKIWKATDWEARLLKRMELRIAKSCDHIFTATQKMIEELRAKGVTAKLHRVPSCVDITKFQFSMADRQIVRAELKVLPDEIVFVYLGKIGGMYMEEEMYRFFANCESLKGSFRYFLFTNEEEELVKKQLVKHQIPLSKCVVKYLERADVPKYLSACDIAFCGIKAIPSRRYSSPIKNGEYWACGLPIVIPNGISDDFLFAERQKIGVVLRDTNAESMSQAIQEALALLTKNNRKELRERCANFAKQDRSVRNYQYLYAEIFDTL